MKLLAIPAAALLVLGLAGVALANHTEPGPCETITFVSEEGYSAILSPGELTFGPFGPGEWPTNYVYDIAPGTYHVQFYDPQGEPEKDNVQVVDPCPTPTPEVTPTPSVTPRPTPSVSGSPPPSFQTGPPPSLVPGMTPPQTDTSPPAYDPEDMTPLVAILVAVLALLVLTAVIERVRPESRDR